MRVSARGAMGAGIAVASCILLIALTSSTPALAQDGAILVVEPAVVEAPGMYEFTVTGSGWKATGPGFLFWCAGTSNPEDIVDEQAAIELCETSSPTRVIIEDGAFDFTGSAEIVLATGGCWIASAGSGDLRDDVITCVPVQVEASADTDELAMTGTETRWLVVVGLGLLAVGMLLGVTTRSRRLR